MTDKYQLGPWQICPASNQVIINGNVQNLEPQAMAVLEVLLANQGLVVSRDELIEQAWKGAIVGDSSVNRTIAQLRKVFGDDAKNPKVIETIPKSGYRLLIQEQTVASTHHQQPVSTRLKVRVLGLAVFVLAMFVLAMLVLTRGWHWNDERDSDSLSLVLEKKLTSELGAEYDTTLSPDGQLLLYRNQPAIKDKPQLIIQSIHTGERWQVPQPPATEIYSPVFTSDSKILYFVLVDKQRCMIASTTVELLTAGVFNPKALIECSRELPSKIIRLGNNGQEIFSASQAGHETPVHLTKINLSSGEQNQITFPPHASWGDAKFEVNQSGTKLAFIRSSPSKQEVFILDLESNVLEQLPIAESGLKSLAWSFNDSKLLLTYPTKLVEWNLDEQKVAQVYSGTNFYSTGFIPRSEHLLVTEKKHRADIWLLDRLSQESRKLIESDGIDQSPIFLSSQNQIAFISDRSGKHQVWLANTDGRQQSQLTRFESDLELMALSWSAGQQQILVWESKRHQIWLIDLVSGNTELIYQSKFPLVFPEFSSSGNRITFGSKQSGDWEIWSINSSGGEERRLTFSGGYYGQLDDSSHQLFFTKYHDKGLWQKQLLTNQSGILINQDVRDDYPWWRLNKKQIYIERIQHGRSAIYEYTKRGEMKNIWVNSPVIERKRFSLSSDADELIFSRQELAEGSIKIYRIQ